jgi:hypothetical protein
MYEKELKKAIGSAISVKAQPFNGKALDSVAKGTSLIGFTDPHVILGLAPRIRLITGDEVIGERPIELMPPKQLFLHCSQIKGTPIYTTADQVTYLRFCPSQVRGLDIRQHNEYRTRF